MKQIKVFAVLGMLTSACAGTQEGTVAVSGADTCGAGQYQGLVDGPSRAAVALTDIPGSSRHYGASERVATNDPNRLNFVHSGTAVEAVVNPASTVVRVFCG